MTLRLMESTGRTFEIVGADTTKIGGYSFQASTDDFHTLSIKHSNIFRGIIYIDGTLATEPEESDWFLIKKFDRTVVKTTRLDVIGYSFEGNFVYIRSRLERPAESGVFITRENEDLKYGQVVEILLNY